MESSETQREFHRVSTVVYTIELNILTDIFHRIHLLLCKRDALCYKHMHGEKTVRIMRDEF